MVRFSLPIKDGPISRNSTVLKPFSPVPTKAITKPRAIVPRPTYKKAFAKVLGPRSTPKKSSSSEEPPNEASCICRRFRQKDCSENRKEKGVSNLQVYKFFCLGREGPFFEVLRV